MSGSPGPVYSVYIVIIKMKNNFVTQEVDYTDKSEDCPHPKFRRILKLLGHLDREARIWDKLDPSCHTVLEIRIASTHSAWRGRGLMRVLCEETE